MTDDDLSRLERLAQLYKDGLLSEVEYQTQKSKILRFESNFDYRIQHSESNTSYQIDEIEPYFDSGPDLAHLLTDQVFFDSFSTNADYYQSKFHKLARSTDSLQYSANDFLSKKVFFNALSFNLAGFIFGPIWGCYRRLAISWLFIIAIVTASIIDLSGNENWSTWGKAIAPLSIVIFGLYGNFLLLRKYIRAQENAGDAEAAYDIMTPSPRNATIALISAFVIPITYPYVTKFTFTDLGSIDTIFTENSEQLSTLFDPLAEDYWTFNNNLDHITGESVTTAAKRFGTLYDIDLEMFCRNGDTFGYKFTAFKKNGEGAPFRVFLNNSLSLYTVIQVRNDTGFYQNIRASRPKYQNEAIVKRNIGMPIDYELFFMDSQILTWKLDFIDGEETIRIDQSGESAQSVIQSCRESTLTRIREAEKFQEESGKRTLKLFRSESLVPDENIVNEKTTINDEILTEN